MATPARAVSRTAAPAGVEAAKQPTRRKTAGLWTNAWYKLRHDRVTMAALAVLLVMVVLAILADVLAQNVFQWGFTRQDLLGNFEPPTTQPLAYLLGSDELGRSQVVRLLYGARISLAVGFGAALINLTIGVVLGLTAGYFRGWVDDFIQFLISTMNSIPSLFLLLIVAVLFTPGPFTLVVILGLLTWPNITLFVRGQMLSIREREFMTAGRVIGASSARLMFQHALPNILPLVFVVAAIDIGTIILVESALSFLGLGINPPTPSWGNMLSNASANLARGPWLVWAPGAAIFLTVLCLYLIGDGLRDALDPRLKHH